MIAVCTLRQEPSYRRNAFVAGLVRCGYQIKSAGPPKSREDLLVQWNRKPAEESSAAAWERMGGTVVVCENGYIGADPKGRQLYAISVHGHNGSGWFPVGVEDRFGALGVELKPWQRNDRGHYLICGQRGIGARNMASPPNWHRSIATKLQGRVDREIRVRDHPGNAAPKKPLIEDLDGCYACMIWSSSSGVKALTLGIPVLYAAPHWIAADAARPIAFVGNPKHNDDDRRAAMHKLSHGQWGVDEIETGEPFKRILAGLWDAKWTP